jgi:hypothetical protein
MFKSAMPNVDDIFRQNPDLMRHFQSAAVNTMGDSNPGFSGFMGNIMGNNKMPPPPPHVFQNNFDDGIKVEENYQDSFGKPEKQQKSMRSNRPDMKGPSDLEDIFSGLKKKTINIQPNENAESSYTNNNSTISITELKDIQSEGNLPKRTRRKSGKNTISVDI